jgi:3,4-dihydroxy 2-butanone 4-phosphate synthase/GTP cyclohydrolase II
MVLPDSPFTDVPTAIEEIRAGRMIVVIDDEDRENEGDLTLAAEKVTPEAINFMAKFGRGLICLTLTEERLDHLRIGPMSAENTSNYGTAFCEAIDARDGVTTGISAHDRARTIQVAIDPATRPSDLARPGHVFPLKARKGGVLVRAGQTEASVDLARLAGLIPAGIICEIMRDDGSMARVPDLIEFCKEHGLKMLTVAEVIRYRMQNERYVHRVGEALIGTRHGEFHRPGARRYNERKRARTGPHAFALFDGRRVRLDCLRLPFQRRWLHASHCQRRTRRPRLSPSDFKRFRRRKGRRKNRAHFS